MYTSKTTVEDNQQQQQYMAAFNSTDICNYIGHRYADHHQSLKISRVVFAKCFNCKQQNLILASAGPDHSDHGHDDHDHGGDGQE